MIPEAAVEAAAEALWQTNQHDDEWVDEFPEYMDYLRSEATKALEAAAPHMLAGPEASIRAVLAYGADREKYTDTGDPKVDAAIKSYAYHVRRVMSEAYESAK